MSQELLDQVEPVSAKMREGILQALKSNLPGDIQEKFDSIEPVIREQAASIEKANAYRSIDMPSAGFVKMTCTLLALYRVLIPEFEERGELLDVIHDTMQSVLFAEGMDAYLFKRFGISKNKPEEAWDMICRNFKKRGEEQFGELWSYEQGIKDAKRCFVNVRKCGFSDFLLANNARELAYVTCVLDFDWGDALEAYGIRLERPTILAEGSDACRFQFFKEQ